MSPTPRTGSVGDARAFVEEYVAAATAADHAPYLALFDDNAVVRDEGRTHRGRTEMRRWRDRVPPVEYDVREVTGTAAACRAVAEVSGAFPGSPVTLHFAFERDARGRITRLEITPAPA
ncbi:nuclear transport factor 2 family protein [Streptomyces pseudogriseolus]|uniref:nuclear transport factor 2 family protein n=1 Tax=Streptomyces pseudogriseolus TaxID=36817 RepID=UPI003FA2A29E